MSKMVKAQKWIKVKEFVGMPTLEDFRLEEEELPELQDKGKSMACAWRQSPKDSYFTINFNLMNKQNVCYRNEGILPFKRKI